MSIPKTKDAFELEDALCRLGIEINKAGFMIQEINDDFFGALSEEVYEPKPRGFTRERAILYEFDRYAAFSGILGDIITKMRTVVEGLKEESEVSE